MSKIQVNYFSKDKTTIGEFMKSNGFGDRNIYLEIKENNVLVNNQIIKDRNYIIEPGSKVTIFLNEEDNELFENDSPIDRVYEDDYFLIVNKPYNLDVEPSRYTTTNNLASMVTHYFKEKNIHSKIHLVNRLDKLTSGLVIIAKNRFIKNLFRNTKIIKKYKCLVEGIISKSGEIRNKIAKVDNQSKHVISESGKECLTSYEVLEHIDGNTLLEVELHTGRTHQIRLSFSDIGHPLVGDPLYGNKTKENRMYLESYYLEFEHPITNKHLLFKI